MDTLARYGIGRIVLHLLAMCGDGNVRFHAAGIRRELPQIGVPHSARRADGVETLAEHQRIR
jgi:hypothetical protein